MPIRQSHIAKDAVKTADLATGAVETEDIKDLAVTTGKLADDSVTRGKIGSIKWGVVSSNPGSMTTDTTTSVDISVSGLTTTDKILALMQESAAAGCIIQAAECPTNGTLRLHYQNTSSGTVDPAAHNVLWVQFKE